MSDPNKDRVYTDTFFARQPIFGIDKNVWGYALLYRHSSEATQASFDDKDVATLTVISNAIMNLPEGGGDGARLLINFTEESILQEIPLALPSETTVVLIDESVGANLDILDGLAKLKEEGYQVAVNNYTGAESSNILMKLADFVFIDTLERDRDSIKTLIQGLAEYPAKLAAKRVEDMDQFDMAKELGFELFQGFFFEKPEIVPGRKLSSNQISRLMLIKVLEKDSPDFDELAKVIQSDVSISYRLLAFINSAAFGFSKKIESIKQAIVLLGWKQIKSWLLLVILTDMAPEGKSSELPYLSTIRGKFLERAAFNHKVEAVKTDSLYLLGLFSLLEALLDMPIKEIAETLPLEDKIAGALCGENNEYFSWLEMAKGFERGDWGRIDEIVTELGLDPMIVANSYAEALAWAKSFNEELTSH